MDKFTSKRSSPTRNLDLFFESRNHKKSSSQTWLNKQPTIDNLFNNWRKPSPHIPALQTPQQHHTPELQRLQSPTFQSQTSRTQIPTSTSFRLNEEERRPYDRITELELQNQKLNNSYMKLSDKYVHLTEQYLEINKRLQEKQNEIDRLTKNSLVIKQKANQKTSKGYESTKLTLNNKIDLGNLIKLPRNSFQDCKHLQNHNFQPILMSLQNLKNELAQLKKTSQQQIYGLMNLVRNLVTRLVEEKENLEFYIKQQSQQFQTDIYQKIYQLQVASIDREELLADSFSMHSKISDVLEENVALNQVLQNLGIKNPSLKSSEHVQI